MTTARWKVDRWGYASAAPVFRLDQVKHLPAELAVLENVINVSPRRFREQPLRIQIWCSTDRSKKRC